MNWVTFIMLTAPQILALLLLLLLLPLSLYDAS